MAILSFRDCIAEEFFYAGRVAARTPWAKLARVAKRKLDMLHYASTINDLRAPPGNHLEMLRGPRKGKHSIRINDQWRIVFRWTPSGPEEVEINDYH